MSNGYAVQEPNTELVNWESAYFVDRNEPNFALGQAISTYLALPGLVGFWPCNITDGSGNVVDSSGNGNHLTRNQTLVNADNNNLFGRLFFSSTTSYATHADASIFDILGTESHIATTIRGLTMGLWIRPNAIGSTQQVMSKYDSSSDRAYWLDINTAGVSRFSISDDGTNVFTVNGETVTVRYHLIICRFNPSSEIAIFVNGVKATNTMSIPASLYNSTGPFRLNQRGDGVNGGASNQHLFAFLCASAISDGIIENIYQQTRGLFGV